MKVLYAVTLALSFLLVGPLSNASSAATYPLYFSPTEVPSELDVTLTKVAPLKAILILRLPAVYSTGASWKISEFPNGEVKISTEELPSTSVEGGQMYGDRIVPKFGRTQLEVLTLPELSVGSHQFTLNYGRGWDAKPWKTVILKVDVIQGANRPSY